MKNKTSVALNVDRRTKMRLDGVLEKYCEEFSSMDELLLFMMDVFDERMVCPRGGVRYRDK